MVARPRSRAGCGDVAEEDVEAGAGADVGDAVAHGSGAEDCDGLDGGHSDLMRLRSLASLCEEGCPETMDTQAAKVGLFCNTLGIHYQFP